MFIKILSILIVLLGNASSSYADNVVSKKELSAAVNKFLNSDEHKNAVEAVKKILPAVVLIHIFDDSQRDTDKIYNSAITQGEHNHYITNGTIVHPTGYIVTTCDTLKKHSRIIVSINSEKRQDAVESSMVLTDNDYEAEVVKKIPELNIAVLKINARNSESFDYVEFSTISRTISQNDSVLKSCSFVVGKASGESLDNMDNVFSSTNNFRVFAYPVEMVYFKKLNGVSFMIPENKILRSCVIPENAGGPLIDSVGKMLGIIDYHQSAERFFTENVVIPVNIVKRALEIAAPSMVFYPDEKLFEGDLQDVDRMPEISARILQSCKELQNGAAGVYVKSVVKDSIADQYGIKAGDIILKFNGELVENTVTMQNMLDRSIGEGSAVFTILRDRNIIEIECMR